MDGVQGNQVARAEKDENFLSKNLAKLGATPLIESDFLPQLTKKIAETYSNDTLATQDNTGQTVEKNLNRTDVEMHTEHVAGGLAAYADATKNFVLFNMVDITPSELQAFRDYRLLQYAKYILNTASDKTVASELEKKYNVSNTAVASLDTSIKAFDADLGMPLMLRAENVAYGKMVDVNIDEINHVLDRIRIAMRPYKFTDRLLYETFLATDTIDDYGHGKTAGKSTTTTGISNPNSTDVAVTLSPYTATDTIEIQNRSSNDLECVVYKNGVSVGKSLIIAPHTTLNTLLSAFSNDGDSLYIINKAASPSNWTVIS